MPTFYYWLKDVRNNSVIEVMTNNYLGDTGESGFWEGIPVIVEDWTYEETRI